MPCSKVRYRDKLSAKIALSRIKESSKRREIRAYKCLECHGWHLTSRAY